MVKGLLISSFYHGWRRGQVTHLTERSSNSPKVTQIARGRPDVGTEALQSDFRSILTITLPCLFRLVFYLAQIHKQTENNVLLCILWKNIETDGYCHTACWLKKKKVRPRGNMVLWLKVQALPSNNLGLNSSYANYQLCG